MIKIIQQRHKCIGCNACVEAAPNRWAISRVDGKATLVGGVPKRGFYSVTVQDWELDDNLRAREHCPVRIIDIVPNVRN